MNKYFTFTKIDKGFINHDDKERLNLIFEVTGNDVKVTGLSADITTWATRANVVEIDLATYTQSLEDLELSGVNARVAELQAELNENNTRKTALMAKVSKRVKKII